MDEEDILASIRNRDSIPSGPGRPPVLFRNPEKGDEKDRERAGQLDSFMDFVREHLDFEFRELNTAPASRCILKAGAGGRRVFCEIQKALDSLHFKGIIFSRAGRFLAAPCGSYLTRVANVNKPGTELLHCVVGGIKPRQLWSDHGHEGACLPVYTPGQSVPLGRPSRPRLLVRAIYASGICL